jgi:uroporphyrinogen-III decarboxylase
LNSHERILKTVQGQKVDRIPVMPFDTFEILKMREGSHDLMFATGEHLNEFTNGWKRKDPLYGEVAQYAAEKGCDVIHRTSFPELDRRFFLIPEDELKVEEKKISDELIQRQYSLKAPKGKLTCIEELKKDFSTTWVKKSLVENKSDIDALLSFPYSARKPDTKRFFQRRDELGTSGVICCFVSTPLVCVSHLFDFSTFLLWAIAEKDTIKRLIENAYERIALQLEYLLRSGVGPIIEFGGSEQATPPMMSPGLYDELVLPYDGRLIELVHNHNCYVRVHCHGKIRNTLPKLMKMGVDLLNPVEGPPSGDVELHEAKRIVNGKMTLEGNLQFSELELSTEERIKKLVKEAVLGGGKERFILTATEWPITYLSVRQKQNYLQFIQSGIEYGSIGKTESSFP